MTTKPPPDDAPGAGWLAAKRELAVAAGLVVAIGAAAWALAGPARASIVVLITVAAGLLGLRLLVPRSQPPPTRPEVYHDTPSTTFAGFWRTQTDLADASASMSAWDLHTRRRLQNLLAARLAERHGISLADDPEAARAILIGSAGRADLWYWIAPDRPTPPDAARRPGIPPRVLAALIQRLEQL
jgi:hypothetical protein